MIWRKRWNATDFLHAYTRRGPSSSPLGAYVQGPSCDASTRSWCKGNCCVVCSLEVDRSLAIYCFLTVIEKQWLDRHLSGLDGNVTFLRGLPQLPSLHFNFFFDSLTSPKCPESSEEKLAPTWSLVLSTSWHAKSGYIYGYVPIISKHMLWDILSVTT